MFPLLDLQAELIEEILRHCHQKELKNLSQCSKSVNQLSKKFLWNRVTIFWKSIIDLQWNDPILENLRYARSVTFQDEPAGFPQFGEFNFNFDRPSDEFYDILKDSWTPANAGNLLATYQTLLSHCDPELVEEFKADRGGKVIYYACNAFPKLKKIDLFGIRDIGPPIDSYDGSNEVRDAEGYLDPFGAMRGLNNLDEMVLCGNILECEDSITLFRPGSFHQLVTLDLADCNSEIFCCPIYLPNLRELNLESTRCGDRGLGMIQATASLLNINLKDSGVTDKGVLKLHKFNNLQILCLNLCHISDAGVRSLCSMNSIKYLDIGYTGITDQAVIYLSQLENLEGLRLHCSKLTADCVSHIMELSSLKYLDIKFAGSREIFSDQAVGRLKSFHPTLKTIEGGKRERREEFSGEDFQMRIRNAYESFKKLMPLNESSLSWRMKAIVERIK